MLDLGNIVAHLVGDSSKLEVALRGYERAADSSLGKSSRAFSSLGRSVTKGAKTAASAARTFKTAMVKFDTTAHSMARTVGRSFGKVSAEASALQGRLLGLQGTVLLLAGGYGVTRLASGFLDTATSFEQMRLKLDALTKGKGLETLEALNAWALRMPVNTQKAVNTFVMMKAMGLDPNIKSMQTLVDVSVLFGEEAMPRVARALGQMKTLGKLSAEELNQLSEVGIDARKYLTEAFGMTVEEIQKAGISIDRVIKAIMRGLDKDFGGAAERAMNNWQGLTATFQSYVTEIQREVMSAGVFRALKDELSSINTELSNWLENNRELIRQKVPEYVKNVREQIKDTWNFIKANESMLEYGLVGLALLGRKGLLVGAAIGKFNDYLKSTIGQRGTEFEALGEAKRHLADLRMELSDLDDEMSPEALSDDPARRVQIIKDIELWTARLNTAQAALEGFKTQAKAIKDLTALQSAMMEESDYITKGLSPGSTMGQEEGKEKKKKKPTPLEDWWPAYMNQKKQEYQTLRDQLYAFHEVELAEKQKHMEEMSQIDLQALEQNEQHLQTMLDNAHKFYGNLEDANRQYNNTVTSMDKKMADKKKELSKDAYNNAVYFLNQMGKHSKFAFKMSKAIAIADATIKGIQATIDAWEWGMRLGGPWLAVAFAAASAAKTAADIDKIRSIDVGSSTGVNSSGAGMPAASGGGYAAEGETFDEGEKRGNLIITVHGDFIGDEAYIEKMAEKISEAVENRNVTLVASHAVTAEEVQ
ncbi:MAG: tape measure protein [Deltaproteobacteria bacterium]|nr:tape measure protein [Deltaproteobacteria bacterium]